MTKSKFPSAYTILFVLIALVAALSWIVPAGKYEMTMNEALGKEVPVAGTYKLVDANPQGIVDVLLAPIDGLYNHDTYEAGAIDVSLFILIIGGFPWHRDQDRCHRCRYRARHRSPAWP